MTQYQPGQLKSLLENLRVQRFNGLARINTFQHPRRTGFLIFNNGEITYGNAKLPRPEAFTIEMGKRLNRAWIESCVSFAVEKLGHSPPVSELLNVITRLQVLKWEELETLAYMDTVLILELLVNQPGELRLEMCEAFDLRFGRDRHALNWEKIWNTLGLRQKMWRQIANTIPSLDAIPCVAAVSVEAINNTSAQAHIEKWVDGKRSLIDIAQASYEDPLKLGRTYVSWRQAGWLTFRSHGNGVMNAPRILSVDDSSTVQRFIQKILEDTYPMSFASNATEALNIMNQYDVGLLLLDVTMPDIDGLEFCRIVRKIPKFKQLPIVMLTANDSLFDKVKGQFSGANHYLTKPVNRTQLLDIVSRYIVPYEPGVSVSSQPLMTEQASQALTKSLLSMSRAQTNSQTSLA